VTFAGYKKGFGNMIIVRHKGKSETRYGWLDDFKVKEKEWVKNGQVLGNVALTQGQPLLYFAIEKDGKYIDPSGVISFE
jgi:stage IV sporulation protein FA